MEEYLGHIAPDGRVQTIAEHLYGTAALCGEFASHFEARELGELAGMTHDIGKYSKEFQARLKNNGRRVDHSTAGAIECYKLKQPHVAYAVIGHHSGLPNGGSSDSTNGRTFVARMTRAANGELCDYSAWKGDNIKLPSVSSTKWTFKNNYVCYFFVRMLYSCLVDADFLDTERFMLGEAYTTEQYSDMAELDHRLETYVSEKWSVPRNELDRWRSAILSSCMERGANEVSELLTLTVPTGGGKTVASLAFALKRALRADSPKCRIIYVIPYTSIIEQTADVFREILGEENVLEHHSGVVYDSDEELDRNALQRTRAVENWDAPIIVTTAVQFFESLHSNRSSKCRKLHNIADSVVIFDEAQMLPLPYLRPCVQAIAQLIEHYGVTAVLCTATQPSLGRFFTEYLPNVIPHELCPTELREAAIFKRVTFRQKGRMSVVMLADELNSCSQVLCIVNSRATAHEIYELLNDEDSAFHLSTLMTAADRKRTLAEIRERLDNGLDCHLISTSLIEAGVDIDFPTVYREEAGLDSILQAAGRCNREGKRAFTDSTVAIFSLGRKPPAVFAHAIAAAHLVQDSYSDLSDEKAIRKYFNEFHRIIDKDATDVRGISKQLNDGGAPYQTIAEQFHLIENDVQTVYIPQYEGEALIELCRYGKLDRSVMRKLGRYGVSVYDDHFKELFAAHDIEAVADDIFVLTNDKLYDQKTGLSLAADFGKADFI